jgi:uncharacterized membrane protein
MSMRTHELHPSLIHAPLVLLPAAGFVDLLAALSPRDRRLDRTGCRLWWGTVAGGLAAGLAGMAASQEIALHDDRSRDRMFVHGFGNVALMLGALGVATWRSSRPASLATATTGLLASAAALYTAYLGGELVYSDGAGVKALGGAAAEAPPLFSREAPGRLARDAVRGLRWLLGRGERALTGKQRIDRTALGPIATAGTGAVAPEAPF